MLCHNPISDQPILSIPQGVPNPYAIEIDDSSEIDQVTLVIVTAFIDPTVDG